MALAILIIQVWRDIRARLDVGNCVRLQFVDEDAAYGMTSADRQSLKVWTPEDVLHKCCWRWILYGQKPVPLHAHEQQLHSVLTPSRGCRGCCGLAHPSVILFFERPSKTIAILSHPLDPFVAYFQRMVHGGTAVQISCLYYVLDGFVRENAHRLRADFPPHLVTLAQDAMEQSDNAQREHMQCRIAERRLGCTPSCDFFEQALEICRLHRLADDLDVFSTYCLRRVSRGAGRVAARIARTKMRNISIVATPLVDGHIFAGYSVFRRRDDLETVVKAEYGRLVEYGLQPDIVCRSDTAGSSERQMQECWTHSVHRYAAAKVNECEFEWSCQELSFATLERNWGDITMHEYVGQHVLVGFRVASADDSEASSNRHGEDSGGANSRRDGIGQQTDEGNRQKAVPVLPLASFRIDPNMPEASYEWDGNDVRFDCRVERNTVRQIDDVTVNYSGRVRISKVEVGFMALVRACSRRMVPDLEAQHSIIERTRPLLHSELAFLREVIHASETPVSGCRHRKLRAEPH